MKTVLAITLFLATSPAFGKCLTYKEAKKEYHGAYLTWKHENGQKCWGVKPRHSPKPAVESEADDDKSAVPVPFVTQFLREPTPPPADCVPEIVWVREPEIGGTDIEQASIWPPLEEGPNIPRVLAVAMAFMATFGFGALAAIKLR